jgi:hypothetical protein
MMRRLPARIKAWLAFALLALGLVPAAHAEVWGYVDAKGVAHFASAKIDERYELFFRGGESFDTSAGVGTPRGKPSTARAVAVFPAFGTVAAQ